MKVRIFSHNYTKVCCYEILTCVYKIENNLVCFVTSLDVDVSGGTSSTTRDDDDDDDDDIGNNTTDEQSHRAADSDTVHITDNITITQPVYVDHH